ncbi:hypothetical protein [Streptomyces griseoflavus]|uniref:hypothetical protein n=1 Tax=Streptomyces griseoflavus TaxID=35619 RepID=UPI00131A3AA7|nr:hypothetical protein [Streptomyces griseoflavus]
MKIPDGKEIGQHFFLAREFAPTGALPIPGGNAPQWRDNSPSPGLGTELQLPDGS